MRILSLALIMIGSVLNAAESNPPKELSDVDKLPQWGMPRFNNPYGPPWSEDQRKSYLKLVQAADFFGAKESKYINFKSRNDPSYSSLVRTTKEQLLPNLASWIDQSNNIGGHPLQELDPSDFKDAESALTQVYKEALKTHQDENERLALVEAQRAWNHYRDVWQVFGPKRYQGTTKEGWGALIDRQRIVDLQFYDNLKSAKEKTYTNSKYGFSIQYPNDIKPLINNQDDYESVHFNCIVEPKKGSPNGDVTVTLRTDPDCYNVRVDADAHEPPMSNATINGSTFLSYETGGAAAGHYFGGKAYRTLWQGKCLTLENSIGTTSVDDPLTQGIEITHIRSKVEPILRSFHFIKAAGSASAPMCALSSDKPTYKLGDVITLSWSSQNALTAKWEAVEDTALPRTEIPPPLGTPEVKGSSTTIANITGNHQITLHVTGWGGVSSCSITVPVTPSDAHPVVKLDASSLTPKIMVEGNMEQIVIRGTIENAALVNSDILAVFIIGDDILGPTDYSTLYNLASNRRVGDSRGNIVYQSAWITDSSSTWEAHFWNGPLRHEVPPAGTYKVMVFGRGQLLASGKLVISK